MSLVTILRPNQQASSALVRTTACRGYVVELDPDDDGEATMLEDLAGRVVHFASLHEVREALHRRGVRQATLVQHHACEELSALGTSPGNEPGISILDETDA